MPALASVAESTLEATGTDARTHVVERERERDYNALASQQV